MSDRKNPRTIPIHPAGRSEKQDGTLEFRTPLPLSLYVHIPWCVQKCPYCDFNSHAVRENIPEAGYLAALVADLESALPLVWGRKIVSIFLGGGTPSLLSGEGIDTLLTALRTRLPLMHDAEITLEANPGTVEAGKFAAFRAAGINRLSLGIQSFDDAHLKALGRIHDGDEARRAIEIAARHFDNFNLDLMYGLPGQTIDQALADVEQALAFGPTHLSCYQLTIEPNTAFAAVPPSLPDPDRCADMQEAIEARLAAGGFAHYETSAFARPGRQCRHNLNYWTFGDYLGMVPAHTAS
jgi:oxygen-independent coproporphyrinogen-3 oxidase